MTLTIPSRSDGAAIPTFELHHRLGRALEHAGVSSNQMAEVLQVTRHTVSRYITGRSKPSVAVLWAWAAITDVDPKWLETGQAPGGDQGPDGYAMRDLNPQPADMESARARRASRTVKPALTVFPLRAVA